MIAHSGGCSSWIMTTIHEAGAKAAARQRLQPYCASGPGEKCHCDASIAPKWLAASRSSQTIRESPPASRSDGHGGSHSFVPARLHDGPPADNGDMPKYSRQPEMRPLWISNDAPTGVAISLPPSENRSVRCANRRDGRCARAVGRRQLLRGAPPTHGVGRAWACNDAGRPPSGEIVAPARANLSPAVVVSWPS